MLRNSTFVYLFAVLCTLMVTPAQARPRTYVASYGADTNPCGRLLPCASITQALNMTDNNGEVVALDSSGYLPFTINKSVTLMAPPGVLVGIAVSSAGAGVTINQGLNGEPVNVVLRGLTINGQGGDNGILMNSTGNLSIENCVISNFLGTPDQDRHGIFVKTAATVRVVDTLVRDNSTGIELLGGATAIISKSKFLGNTRWGIVLDGVASTTTADVRDTLVTGSINGILAYSDIASAINRINITRSIISNNYAGVSVVTQGGGTASASISKNMITRSDYGLYILGSGATLKSYSNNTLIDNISDTSFPLPFPPTFLVTPM